MVVMVSQVCAYIPIHHVSRSVLCVQSCLTLTAPWTVAHQASLSMGFSRQEHCIGLPFSTPGSLPNPGIESMFLASPALAGGFFTFVYQLYLSKAIQKEKLNPMIFKTH